MPAAIVPVRRKAALFIEIVITPTLQSLATQRGYPDSPTFIPYKLLDAKVKSARSPRFNLNAAKMQHLVYPAARNHVPKKKEPTGSFFSIKHGVLLVIFQPSEV
jgi:hypothetical protein